MTRTLLLFAGLSACRGRAVPEGLPAPLTAGLRFCQDMRGEAEDWCSLEMIKTEGGDLRTEQAAAVCLGMTSTGPRDACLELAVHMREPEAWRDLCAQIVDPRLRDSCWLGVADSQMMSDRYSVDDVVEACQRTGDAVLHCLAHITERRARAWHARGGLSAMVEELPVVVAAFPQIADFVDFGNGVARAARVLGATPGDLSACALLPEGGARRGCEGLMAAELPEGVGGGFNASATPLPGR